MKAKGFKSSSKTGHTQSSPACAAASCPVRVSSVEKALVRSIFSTLSCARTPLFFGDKWRELLVGCWHRDGSVNEESKLICSCLCY